MEEQELDRLTVMLRDYQHKYKVPTNQIAREAKLNTNSFRHHTKTGDFGVMRLTAFLALMTWLTAPHTVGDMTDTVIEPPEEYKDPRYYHSISKNIEVREDKGDD